MDPPSHTGLFANTVTCVYKLLHQNFPFPLSLSPLSISPLSPSPTTHLR